MPFNSEISELGAKSTAVGAAVGDVQIQAVADDICDTAALIYLANPEETPGIKAGNTSDIFQRQTFNFGEFLGR